MMSIGSLIPHRRWEASREGREGRGFEPSAFWRDMERMFDDFLSRSNFSGGEEESAAPRALMPPMDVREEDDAYEILADMPGVNAKELEVSLSNGMLHIVGRPKPKETKEEKNGQILRYERSHGWFERSFTLPPEVDAEKIKAELKDGVLHLSLPKSEKARKEARQIPINAS
ncbi:Hsp20/alpha crystallin family protein [Fodinicurvata fenggangensis]|uniref:Hsp20/alpha crystallin family protein n=1 Tax=Fodinicurvata fenggangensis TaxID=1121830 RepID=UPI00138E3E48|nr:Hsp20/alpha crystallin family protein [Fodinicurvata fenggangensis]